MMVLQFIAAGAILPIFSLYLTENLHFNGFQTGLIIAMSSIAVFISPVVTSLIADRIISAEKLYTICQFFGALTMGALSLSTDFYPVLFLYLLYALIVGPTFALINAIIFHNSSEQESGNFGFLRVWGTIGWIIAAWAFYFWLNRYPDRIPDALKFSCITTGVLALFSLTFPKTAIRAKPEKIFPRESLRVMIQPGMMFLLLFGFCIFLIEKYYYYGAAPFLKSIGFENKMIMPVMSIGQISEIAAMLFTGALIKKFGSRTVMLFGLIMEIVRYYALYSGHPVFFVFTGLFAHGFAYTFFFVPYIVTLDSLCSKEARTGVHQLSTIVTSGCGNLAGALLAGIVLDAATKNSIVDYKTFWLVPMIVVGIGFFVLWGLKRFDTGRKC